MFEHLHPINALPPCLNLLTCDLYRCESFRWWSAVLVKHGVEPAPKPSSAPCRRRKNSPRCLTEESHSSGLKNRTLWSYFARLYSKHWLYLTVCSCCYAKQETSADYHSKTTYFFYFVFKSLKVASWSVYASHMSTQPQKISVYIPSCYGRSSWTRYKAESTV